MPPSITDWLMVIITFIYVAATCAICYFNWRSTNEARKQYEDEKKYRVLPWFHVSIFKFEKTDSEIPQNSEIVCVYSSGGHNSIQLPLYRLEVCTRNIGQGTATRFKYDWKCPDGVDSFPVFFANQSLMSGEAFSNALFVSFTFPNQTIQNARFGFVHTRADMVFTFFDIYNREYTQEIGIHFKIHEKNHVVEAEIEAGIPQKANW
ncbi:MAG: hypothetical protein IJI06_09320 [Oscillospiraceae bacterium]|nr:hypothetical protein [Oscillospiraceae bacterium]